MIPAMTPPFVVFFQNSIITIAGRLAEAATANAQPTRNDTFIAFEDKTQQNSHAADTDGSDARNPYLLFVCHVFADIPVPSDHGDAPLMPRSGR